MLNKTWQEHITYINDIQHSYMAVRLSEEYKIIDYQVRMLQENPADSLLALHKKQMDDHMYLFYDISSKITLCQLLSRKKITKHELLTVLKSFIAVLKLGEEYLLLDGSFILNSDYIYVNPATMELSMAYLPVTVDFNVKQAVREFLIDLIIYRVSFEPVNQGDFVYELLNFLKSEGFSLNELDKVLNNLALQKEYMSKENVDKAVFPVANGPDTAVEHQAKISLKHREVMIFISVQVFLAALSVLSYRVIISQALSLAPTSIVGVACIVMALDVLIIKKLKLFQKPKSDPNEIKNKKVKIQKVKKQQRPGLYKSNYEENKVVSTPTPYIDPRTLETRLLKPNLNNPPYLEGVGESLEEKIIIDKPSFIIGRIKNQVDYISKNNAIGKLHAEIIQREGVYYIKDLNSRNGTFINGERIVGNTECLLRNNDRIAFANCEFQFMLN